MKHRQIAKRIAWAAGLAGMIYVGYGVVSLFLWDIQFSMGMDSYQQAESVDHGSSTLLMGAVPLFQNALELNPHDSSSLSMLGRIRIKEVFDHLREGRQQKVLESAREAATYFIRAMHLSPAEAQNRLLMGYLLIALSRYRPVSSEAKQKYFDGALAMAPKNARILQYIIALYRYEADWERALPLLRKFSALTVERNPKNLDFLRTDTSREKMLELTNEFFMKTIERGPEILEGTLPAQKQPEPTGKFPLVASASPALQENRGTTSSAAAPLPEAGQDSLSFSREINEPSEEVKALLAAMAEADANRQRLLQERRQPVLRWFSRLVARRNPFILDDSLSERERDAVLKGIEDAVAREPVQAPLLYVYAAGVARSWNRLKIALKYLQQAAEMLPDSPLLPEALGDLYREMGIMDKAIAAYRRAIELPSHSVSVYHRIAQIQLDQGDPAAAELTFRKAMLVYPDHHAPYIWLGDYYHRYARRFNLAVAMFQKARKLKSDNPIPYAGMAYSLEAMGREVEAIKYFLKAASHQYNSEQYRAEAARIYQKQGKYREAISVLKMALARHGSDEDALLRMGEIHLALKDYPAAAGYFELCLYRNPLHYWARLGAALAYEQMDRPIQAISLLEAARSLYPRQTQPYEHLARIYERMGEAQKANELRKMAP